MQSYMIKFMLLVTLAGVVLAAGGCEDAFKDVKLPSLADSPQKMGAPKP